MAKSPIERRDSYRVGSEDVFISIDVGLGQIGRVSLELDDKRLGTSPTPVGDRLLGAGDDLVDRLLTADITVTDVSTMTNKLNAVVLLKGGAATKLINLNDQVKRDGQSMTFRVFVLFLRKAS